LLTKNTRTYLSEAQRVEDWDYNFLPLPSGGIPTEVVASERSLKLSSSSISLKYYGRAHLSVQKATERSKISFAAPSDLKSSAVQDISGALNILLAETSSHST
jgi:hypothetical protein